MQPRVALFGDSHSYAVQRAIERRETKGRRIPLIAHRLRKEKAGKILGDTSFEEFLEKVREFTADDVVFSLIGGNQHAVFSTIQHPRPFDILMPGESGPPAPGAELIPYRVASAFLAEGVEGRDGKSIAALRAATDARVIHVMPPPPKRDNGFILSYHETRFAEDNIAALGVSSPALRMKVWKLQTRLLQALCAKLGVETMMPSADALDADGFLAEDYYANDATHANASYGEVLLKEIEASYLDGRGALEALA